MTQIVKPGHDIYSWYMPKWLGVDPSNGDPVWEKLVYDDSGKVVGSEPTNVYNDAQKQIVGSATPKFSGGFFNNFRLYNFSLNVACNFVYGNEIFNLDRTIMDNDGAFTNYNMVSFDNGLKWKRWEKPATPPRTPKPFRSATRTPTPYRRCYSGGRQLLPHQEHHAGLQLPEEAPQQAPHAGAEGLRFGRQLATFTKFSGMDPEDRPAGIVL